VGRHLLERLVAGGHQAVCVARRPHASPVHGVPVTVADVGDADKLCCACEGCDAIVHLAGINRARGAQTFERVHVQGTRNVVAAARAVGASKVLTLSFLKARPDCGSRYHETKWESERIVAQSGLDYVVLKAGVVFGPGDGMIANIWRAIRILPVFGAVGLRPTMISPVWVGDVAELLGACATSTTPSCQTVSVVGPEAMSLADAVRRVARAMHRPVLVLPLPLAFHHAFGWVAERVMSRPLASVAQVRMLAEGLSDPLPGAELPPVGLRPTTRFDGASIAASLPGRR
jgi:NADH dehydrogenase